MSLVGPRPHPLDDVDRYELEAYRRLALKPGLTGLWQVEGRSDLTWSEALQLDLYYVESWSLSGRHRAAGAHGPGRHPGPRGGVGLTGVEQRPGTAAAVRSASARVVNLRCALDPPAVHSERARLIRDAGGDRGGKPDRHPQDRSTGPRHRPTSGMDDELAITTGTPDAIPSSGVSPNPSYRDVWTSAVQLEYARRSCSSSRLTWMDEFGESVGRASSLLGRVEWCPDHDEGNRDPASRRSSNACGSSREVLVAAALARHRAGSRVGSPGIGVSPGWKPDLNGERHDSSPSSDVAVDLLHVLTGGLADADDQVAAARRRSRFARWVAVKCSGAGEELRDHVVDGGHLRRARGGAQEATGCSTCGGRCRTPRHPRPSQPPRRIQGAARKPRGVARMPRCGSSLAARTLFDSRKGRTASTSRSGVRVVLANQVGEQPGDAAGALTQERLRVVVDLHPHPLQRLDSGRFNLR